MVVWFEWRLNELSIGGIQLRRHLSIISCNQVVSSVISLFKWMLNCVSISYQWSIGSIVLLSTTTSSILFNSGGDNNNNNNNDTMRMNTWILVVIIIVVWCIWVNNWMIWHGKNDGQMMIDSNWENHPQSIPQWHSNKHNNHWW